MATELFPKQSKYMICSQHFCATLLCFQASYHKPFSQTYIFLLRSFIAFSLAVVQLITRITSYTDAPMYLVHPIYQADHSTRIYRTCNLHVQQYRILLTINAQDNIYAIQ